MDRYAVPGGGTILPGAELAPHAKRGTRWVASLTGSFGEREVTVEAGTTERTLRLCAPE